jgi:hypothetical protein
MKRNSDLGFLYIAEQTSPEQNEVKNFDVTNKDGVFFVDFESCIHSFDVMNRNIRMYDGDNVMECLNTERMNHYFSHGGLFGEQNHPIPIYKDRPLSPERIQDIDMNNTSHKIFRPRRQGNLLIARIQSDAGTAAGMNLAKKMVQGFIPGFSCRAIASMSMKNGKPVVDVRKIITYDWVLFQSHREAEQIQSVPNKFVHKVANAVNEYVTEETGSEDVSVPVSQILEYAGYKDVNAQVVMEAFELDKTSLVGFSKDNKQIIMKDSDNTIYCNMLPETRNKVNDYLRSLY